MSYPLPISPDVVGSTVTSTAAAAAASLIPAAAATAADTDVSPILTSYIRIAFTAIAAYDYVITIPREWKLYRGQIQNRRASLAAILFCMIRYFSLVTIVSSQIGWFGTGFSVQTCAPYHLVAPIMSVLCTSISQIIISVRTYATSRKAPWVFFTLLCLFIVSNAAGYFGAVYKKVAVQNSTFNCTSGNLPGGRIGWVQFLAPMVYDTVAISISSYYLFSPSLGNGMWFTSLSAAMFGEGLIYFFVLTLVNTVNVIFFKVGSIPIQTTGTSALEVATMILSERFILNLYERMRGTAMLQAPTSPQQTRKMLASMPSLPITDETDYHAHISKKGRVEEDEREYGVTKTYLPDTWDQRARY